MRRGREGRDTVAASGEKVETIIGPGTHIEGVLRTKSGLRVEGSIEGKIFSESDVVIGESGRVQTDIEAENLTVAGEIRGDVKVRGRLTLLSTGRLFGAATPGTLIVEPGAIWQGESRMETKDGDGGQGRNQRRGGLLGRAPEASPERGGAAEAAAAQEQP